MCQKPIESTSLRLPFGLKTYHLGLVIVLLLSFLVRWDMVMAVNPDFKRFLQPWYNFILEHSGFQALEYGFSNYTPPYLYLLTVAAGIFGEQVPAQIPIKSISIFFDFANALLVYRIIRKKCPHGPNPAYGVLVFLFAPSVVLNSAYWGQADGIFTTGILACIYFLLDEKEILAFVFYGLALATKLQAIFALPFLLVLGLRRKVSWKSFTIIPAVYLLAIAPAGLAGRPLDELLLVYLRQAEAQNKLTLGAPTLYAWLPNSLYSLLLPLGLIFAGLVVLGLMVLVHRAKVDIQKDGMLALAFLSLLVVPFVLPKMHERYFYPADVFSILFAFYFPQFFYVPVVVVFVSTTAYFPFLFRQTLVEPATAALVLLALIVHIVLNWRRILPNNIPKNQDKF